MINYFLTSKTSRLTSGHIQADKLYTHILEHDGSTAYCCYFDLVESSLKLEWNTGKKDRDGRNIYEYHPKDKKLDYKCNGPTFTQYEGAASLALGYVSFDFDAEDPAEAMEDVKNMIEWLSIKDVVVFFSGSKGFHLMIPKEFFPLESNEHLPNQLKDLAKYLKEFYPTLDDSIYSYNHKFRVPFTRHEITGLYKICVDVDYLFSCHIEDIIEEAEHPNKLDFIVKEDRTPLPVIIEAIENSKRKSYEIDRDKAGTVALPSPFEKFDNKLCVKKMLESRCDDVGRNNACIRIVNDYFRTGKTQAKCEIDVFKWSQENELPMSEVSMIISNIYERGSNYNFGCQDECKSIYCSAKCPIWKKLDPDKRPMTVDMPQSALAEQSKAKQPKEFDVVSKILLETFKCDWDDKYKKFENGFICKQGKKDLFYYKEGYWQHLNDEQVDLIKIKFNAIYENILTTRRIDGIFKMFLMYVPSRPKKIDMFTPRNNVANFRNGTLHLNTDLKGNYSFEFLEHCKNDYITFKVDYDYDINLFAINDKFESWLLEYLSSDQEQFNLIQEMFGASLVPTFPQLFVLLGAASTGKSTCMKVLKMMHENNTDNLCGVPPHKFNGFNMSSMIGKLVNMVTDIKTNTRIDDDIVKQIEDRGPIRIERKGQDDVYAPLPALHIFGANSMPQTFDGYSGAMNRRWSIIEFNKPYTGVKNRNISSVLFNAEPQGVVNFAVKGLLRLACNNQGFFSKSKISSDEVSEWTSEDDIIQLFLNDCIEEGIDCGGELIKISLSPENKILRPKFWGMFNIWQTQALARNEEMGRNKFFKMVKAKKIKVRKLDGLFYFLGIGELSGKNLGHDKI